VNKTTQDSLFRATLYHLWECFRDKDIHSLDWKQDVKITSPENGHKKYKKTGWESVTIIFKPREKD